MRRLPRVCRASAAPRASFCACWAGSASGAVVLAEIARCTWLSISPGISVRPPPAMRVSAATAGGRIGAADIAWILLPTTSTFEAADSRSDLPSKMRTFSIRTALGLGDGAGVGVGVGACACAAVAPPSAAAASSSALRANGCLGFLGIESIARLP
jgi:hypothetical protein